MHKIIDLKARQILDSRGITVINAFQPGLLFTKKELTPEEEIIKNMLVR